MTDTLQDMEVPSDADLFNDAVGKEVVEDKAPEPEPVSRDDKGRFAAKEEPEPVQAKEPEKPVEKDEPGGIPSWRLREEAEQRRAYQREAEEARRQLAEHKTMLEQYQRQLQQMQAPKAPAEPDPDPLLDPQGYAKRIEARFEEKFIAQQREFDLRLAQRTHGEVFDKAYQAAQQALANGDIQLRSMMNATNTPGETLVNWYRQKTALETVGTDPTAWARKQAIEWAKSDPEFQKEVLGAVRGIAAQNSQSRPNVNLPPSLSTLSRGDASTASDDDNDISDAALFAYAMNSKRR